MLRHVERHRVFNFCSVYVGKNTLTQKLTRTNKALCISLRLSSRNFFLETILATHSFRTIGSLREFTNIHALQNGFNSELSVLPSGASMLTFPECTFVHTYVYHFYLPSVFQFPAVFGFLWSAVLFWCHILFITFSERPHCKTAHWAHWIRHVKHSIHQHAAISVTYYISSFHLVALEQSYMTWCPVPWHPRTK